MKTENNDLKKKGGRGKWWNGVQTYINVKLGGGEKERGEKKEWWNCVQTYINVKLEKEVKKKMNGRSP